MARDWKGGNASTFKTIGASNHCDEERADKDYYATEPAATDWLCRLEQFSKFILEPSCGEGHMSEVLKRHGYDVTSRDLADRGYGEVADFLAEDNTEWHGDIVTNPPYAFAQQFVEKALAIIRAECSQALNQHLIPDSNIVDDSKITDLLEEYGADEELPEGWYLEEYDASEILMMI